MTWPLPALSDEERLTFAELPAFEVHLRAWMEVQADHTHRGISRMACGCGAVLSNVDERSEHVTDVCWTCCRYRRVRAGTSLRPFCATAPPVT